MLLRGLVILIAIVGCRKREAAPAPPRENPDVAQAKPDPAKPDQAKPVRPMKVMAMSSAGFLRITENGKDREEALPESPLGQGEFPEGCWVTDDGALYAVGKQYTGVPGPDFGAVWKRAPDGTWSTEFRLKDRTFHSIAGNAKQIVVGTLGGYVVFDGTTWRVHDQPHSLVNVWTDGNAIFGQDFDDTLTFEIVNGEPRQVVHKKHDSYDTKYVCSRGNAKYRVFEKSTELGERELSPEEEAEIRGEMKQIEDHPERVRAVKP